MVTGPSPVLNYAIHPYVIFLESVAKNNNEVSLQTDEKSASIQLPETGFSNFQNFSLTVFV